MNTYIVSGRMRSGTSMMMRACDVGGLRTMYKQSIKELIEAERAEELTGYVPNPDGFYEHPMMEYTSGDTDKLVCKVIGTNLKDLPVVKGLKYKIVFMMRPIEEIIVSAKRAFNHPCDNIISVEEAKDIINSREDFDVVYLNYHDVVADPTTELQKLKDNGWPIDVEKAATVPTPDLYRNRL